MKRVIRNDELVAPRSTSAVDREQAAKVEHAKTRAERIEEAQKEILATYAETFRRLAE